MSTPIVVRVRLRFNDVETFVDKFAPNVTRGGLFLATRNLREVGEVIAFELLLANGTLALGGEGKIIWTKAPDPALPNKPFGMGVQFVSVRPESKPILARLLKARENRPPAPRTTGALPTLEASGPTGSVRVPIAQEGSLSGSLSKPVPVSQPKAGPKVDPHVDLALEMGFDEPLLREVASRLRMSPRSADPSDALEELLKPAAEEPATLARALAELPRLLGAAARRRSTGGFRTLEAPVEAPVTSAESASTAPAPAERIPVTNHASTDGAADLTAAT